MCGIAGSFSLDHDVPVDRELLVRMIRPLAHRGPDDSGCYVTGGVGLGFSRLAILDLVTGNQPHFNEDASIASVCNGEIYNYRDLRRELEAKGHAFRTHCDVEVLVHLYEEHGTEFIKGLNGQFAFALYDGRTRQLILARDHVGIAPLFYTIAGRTLLFASEIKALLAHPAVDRAVNIAGLDQILTFPGLVSPATMFKGVYSLKPGHFLRAGMGSFQTHEYWDLIYPECDGGSGARPESFYVEQLQDALFNAVESRLHADVPVGFYLSGGLDSSLIASIVHAARPAQRFHSFSIAFPQSDIDERRYQRMMSDHVQSIHHETEFDQTEIISRLRSAVVCAETPLKESYNTCSLALSELVRRAGLKVVLTGEGADELFAGYVGYRFDAAQVRRVSDEFDVEEMLEDEVRERLWGDPDFFYEKDYLKYRELKSAIYSTALAAELAEFDAAREPLVDKEKLRNRHRLHKRSYVDFKMRLADHLLADHGDRVSYANSVEARYPFLDLNVIEAARTMPPGLLIKDAVEKYVVRAAAGKFLPPAVVNREKFGFVAPGTPYLLSKQVEWVNDLLAPETIRRQGYFDPDTIQRLRTTMTCPGASINTTFSTDVLMIVLTFGIFLDAFEVSAL
jgi:asparagine synthase (glutamine-hydrolysing)